MDNIIIIIITVLLKYKYIITGLLTNYADINFVLLALEIGLCAFQFSSFSHYIYYIILVQHKKT